MSTASPWRDEPLKLLPTPAHQTKKTDMWTEGASHMCNVHNALFRGFNSIYQQAPHVVDEDKVAFIGYCQTWVKFLHSHTQHEETGLFIMAEELLQEKVFDDMHEAHEAILGPLRELETYLTSVATTPLDFSAPRLLAILDALHGPLERHFNDEVARIASLATHARTPAAGSAEERAAVARFDKWGQASLMEPGVTDVLVFFLLNMDRAHEDGRWHDWPPIPAPVRWAMVNVAGQWHRGWWKFASCDARGQRREFLNLTKLDVFDTFETIKIAIAYKLDGEELDSYPADLDILERAEVVYDEMPGWQTPTTNAKTYDELPEKARDYVEYIEKFVGVKIKYIGTGPEREAMVLRA